MDGGEEQKRTKDGWNETYDRVDDTTMDFRVQQALFGIKVLSVSVWTWASYSFSEVQNPHL